MGRPKKPHVRTSVKGKRFSAGRGDLHPRFQRDINRLSAHINRPQYVYPISLPLRKALGEIRQALMRNDILRAAELSRVKSYIAGNSDEGSPNAFWESGSDHRLYSYLDSLHHELAMATGSLPSGMMVMRSDGKMFSRPPAEPTSPTLKLIAQEDARIREDSQKRMETSTFPNILKRKKGGINFNEKQEYDYDWKGYGLELSERAVYPRQPVSTRFLQGDEASELHDQLEKAKNNWQVNRIIEPYFTG